MQERTRSATRGQTEEGSECASIKDDMYDESVPPLGHGARRHSAGIRFGGQRLPVRERLRHGEYWAYFHDNLFAVNAFDMTFEHAGVMRYRHAEHLSIGYYEAADLIVQSGGSCAAGAISTYLAEEGAESWRSTSRVRRPARPPSPSRPITTATTCGPASGTSPRAARLRAG